MRVFVCGDLGKSILFDIEMDAHQMVHEANKTTLQLPEDAKKWKEMRPWFSAHTISAIDSHYVSTVKLCKAAGVYVTATNKGEVKLWSAIDCEPVGTLNSKDYIERSIRSNIHKWKAINDKDKF